MFADVLISQIHLRYDAKQLFLTRQFYLSGLLLYRLLLKVVSFQSRKETDNVKCFFGRDKMEVLFAISAADAYIMNSYEEGFGLVLLESMMNNTPWYARDIAGAHDMCYHGTLYKDEKELMELLRNHKRNDKKIEDAYNYVMCNHTIQDTCNDIEDVLLETLR